MNSVLGETVLTESDPTKGSRAIKRKRVVEFLDRQNLDGVLLTLQSNFAWYTDGARGHTNIASEESIAELLVTRAEEHLFVNAIESRRLTTEELRWNAPVVHINAWWDDPSRRSLVKKEFGSRIVYDSGALRQEFARLRYSLLPHEIERYRALGRDVAGVFWDIIPTLKPGMAEFDLAAEISGRLLRKGVEAIVLLVAFDERAKAYRHPIATMNTLKKVALVSVCGRRHGLIASATRQYVLGGVSEEFRLKHAAVARVDAWLLHETAPNLRVAELFRGLKEQYASVGYPNEWYLHHQGGAAGYMTRDYRASEQSREVVQVNQAFAWNPTITGTKSEDTVIIGESGYSVLTDDPRWPKRDVELNGSIVQRPDLLILD